MIGKVVVLIFLSLTAHANETQCNFGLNDNFTKQLEKNCNLFINYCEQFAKEASCLDRMSSTETSRNHFEKASLINYSNQRLELANNIFLTVSISKEDIKEKDVLSYENKLIFLDNLSRHPSPQIKEFILDIKNNLQAHWMAEYFHSWVSWQSTNREAFKKAGLPLSYLSGAIAINNVASSSAFSQFINRNLPGKIFSLTSSAFKLGTPYLTMSGTQSLLNTPPILMPKSPAHFIRFDYKNVSAEDFEAIVKTEESNHSQQQIRASIALATLFLVDDVTKTGFQIFPKWIPKWGQKLLKAGSLKSAPAASKFKMISKVNVKNLIRITPQSLVISLAVDQAVGQSLKSYSKHELNEALSSYFQLENSETPVENIARQLLTTLAEMDIFYTDDYRRSFYSQERFVFDIQNAIDHQEPLHLFLDRYFAENFEELQNNSGNMLRILSCNSMRSIDYVTVGKRSIEKVEDEYQERQETYLSGLWTFIELIQNQLQKNQLHKDGLVFEILEQKLSQLQQEYKLVSKKPKNLNFRNWQKHMVNDWFVPVAQHYSAKRYEAMHGYNPRNSNKKTSRHVEREIEYDQLSYCQLK